MKSAMRTSLSCILLAAFLAASAVLASCSRRPTPAPAPAPTFAPAALPPPAPTSARAPTAVQAAPTSAQTVVVEKKVVGEEPVAKPATLVITTPTPPSPYTPDTVSQTDWERIRTAGRIVVGVSSQYRPFAYYDEKGELNGFDVAVVQETGRRLGLTAVARDVTPAGLMDALRNRQIDLALPSSGGVDGSEAIVEFTKPYHVCRDVILAVERSPVEVVRLPSDLTGRAIAVLDGSRHEAWLEETLVERGQLAASSLFTFTLMSQLVSALWNGQVDLAIVDAVQATPLLKQGGVRLVGQDLNKQDRSLALPRGADLLRSELDRTLADMARDGTLARLSDQYLGLEPADLAPLDTYTPAPLDTPTPSPTPTTTPPSGSFVAEPIHIAPGECTHFTWNLENVREIYFYVRGDPWEDSPTTGQESRQICPARTGTYELRIVHTDGVIEVRPITILVDERAHLPLSSRLSTTPVNVVRLGDCVVLSWEVRGDPARVQIVRDQTVLWSDAPQAGSLQDCPSEAGTVVYSVLASGPGQTIQTQRVMTVNP